MQGFVSSDIERARVVPPRDLFDLTLGATAVFSKGIKQGGFARPLCEQSKAYYRVDIDPIKDGGFDRETWDADGDLASLAYPNWEVWKAAGTTANLARSATAKYGDYSMELAHDAADLRLFQYFRLPPSWLNQTIHLVLWNYDTDAGANYTQWELMRSKSDGSAEEYWDDGGGSWTTTTWNDIAASAAAWASKSYTWTADLAGWYRLQFKPKAAAAGKTTLLDDVGMARPATEADILIPAGAERYLAHRGPVWRLSGIVDAGTPVAKVHIV